MFTVLLLLLLLYSPPGSELSKTQLGGKKTACLETQRCVFSAQGELLFVFQVKPVIVVVPGSGPWVMLPDGNLLLCPLGADGSHFSPTNTGFCCVFCVRNGLAWLLWCGNVTTWEGDVATTASLAGQWEAALPSGSHGKHGNQVRCSVALGGFLFFKRTI